jgi:neutral amino acid transport system permease protein
MPAGMEAGTLVAETRRTFGERIRETARQRPALVALAILGLILVAMVASTGLHDVAQRSVNGLSTGSIYALGAVGLTLVYGILKLVNFAHGDFLTFGAYMAYLVNVTWGLPLVAGIAFAMLGTALLGLTTEFVLWRPLRARRAGLLQLLLVSIGLAFVIRSGIQFAFNTDVRVLDIDRTNTVSFLGLELGVTELVVIIVGFVVLVGTGLMLRFTLLGKRMRALSDDLELAETSGIDTEKVIRMTWIFAGALAGLAGVLDGAITSLNPNFGFQLLLPIFAAVVLGGIGDAFGALAAGIILGIVTEWSTLYVDSRWKLSFGFVALLIGLIVRPQGIFGKAKAI